MKAVHQILIFSGIFLLSGMFLFQVNAQTRVIKMPATKSNDYGIQYFLPKTVLKISVNYSKINKKAGTYAKYAEKYLGVQDKDVVLEDQTSYILDNVSVTGYGIPNKDESYLVEFKSKTTAPFVYLTEDGMICTINAEYQAPSEQPGTDTSKGKSNSQLPVVDPKSVLTEEYLRAGSVSKMAEVAAKQIYKLRESRTDILTGDADNTPKDGEAMKIVLGQLEAQEKALTELFTGTTVVEKKSAEFELDPQADMENHVIFRFSKYLGIVDANDLSGIPVYMNLKNTEPVAETPVDPKAKEKESKSIVYNIPGKGSVEIFYGKERICNATIPVTQFGTKQVLASSIFEDKKVPVQVYFYPETGAVRQIIQ